MRFELTIERSKAAVGATTVPWSSPAGSWGSSFWGWIREPFAGAWQKNLDRRPQNVLSHSTVYSCVTLIASDIGKLALRLMINEGGIWSETTSSSFSPVLRKPNRYQTRQKFIEQWVVSKLIHGNTYVLKERDDRGLVVAMYILDPTRVYPLVAPDGSVFYQLSSDNLAGVEQTGITVPASEIIHDLMVALYHPLCGVSPITACALPAVQSLSIQEHASKFFANGAKPGGILTAPGLINEITATRIKNDWDANYGGENVGKVAVLGDGLKYEAMGVNAVDSELIKQLQWTSETVCSVFHVPPYMVGVGPPPTINNIEALNTQYYAQCLQCLIEAIENSLDDGLRLPISNPFYGTEFNLDDLLRMDTAARVKSAVEGIGGGLFAPDEARRKFDLKSVKGGATPYMQQQNFSLAALDARDRAAPAPSSTSSQSEPPVPPAKFWERLLENLRPSNQTLLLPAPGPSEERDKGEEAEDLEGLATCHFRAALSDHPGDQP